MSLRSRLSVRFRAVLSGSPNGIPQWTPQVSAGDDMGLFGPTDAPWVVHADIATMIGGIRALLMQAMHPGSLAGVMQHSRYEEDALGRLAGTIRWLTIATFASRSALAAESERVREMHARVRGKYAVDGEQVSYSAQDPHLLEWVHIAFTDSFLAAHLAFGKADIPGGADAYIGQWAQAVTPLGVDGLPTSELELRQRITEFDAELRVDERTQRVIRFIRRPPLPGVGKLVYRVLFAAALHTLPTSYRERLGLRVLPAAIALPIAKGLMALIRYILGKTSPLESAALERRARLAKMETQS